VNVCDSETAKAGEVGGDQRKVLLSDLDFEHIYLSTPSSWKPPSRLLLVALDRDRTS